MKLHEYQAKRLLASAGIPVPRGVTATTPDEARSAYEALRGQRGGAATFACNVKAQLHAGGRGKAGGVLVAHSAQEAASHAASLLGRRLRTSQTGPEGLPVSVVLVDERIQVREELYLALTVDRFRAQPIVLASRRGGMDIEKVAASEPSAIIREGLDVVEGVRDEAAWRIASALGLSGEASQTCTRMVRAMWTLFVFCDAALIEINPFARADDGRLVALDAKVVLNDNALFRQPELAAWRDESQEAPLELAASRIGISYVGLSGTIGCLVNGAGLAMATNDLITLAGGAPANFLDVGGGANVEQVTKAFEILLADARVKAILVNIFGGIMRCDWIAQGLLNAAAKLEVRVPIVVRLEGTNVEAGRRLLRQASRLNLLSLDDLAEAARKAVELAA